MRNLLALIGLVVVGFAGLGWYMGWYKLSFNRTPEGNLEIKTDVDTKKVGDDSATFFKNAAQVVGNHIEKSNQDAKASAPSGAPGGTPGPGGASSSSPFNPLAPTAPDAPKVAPGPSGPAPINLIPPK